MRSPVSVRPPAAPTRGANTLRCLVVDDQPDTLDRSARMLRSHPSVGKVSKAADATAAVRILCTSEVDVAFIEVRMPDMNGVELAWMLKRFRSAPAVVFLTRCPKSAADAFELGAVDYLCKPLEPERLAESLRRVSVRHAASVAHRGGPTEQTRVAVTAPAPSTVTVTPDRADTSDVIPVEVGTTTKLVPRSSVRWVHAQGDYARLYTDEGSYLIRAKLAVLADCWRSAGHVRIHRSYLVQLRFVTAVKQRAKQLSVMVDGQQLPVSRRLAPVVREQLLHAARSKPAA